MRELPKAIPAHLDSTLAIRYSTQTSRQVLTEPRDDILAVIEYGSAQRSIQDNRVIPIELTEIGGQHTEIWTSNQPVSMGACEGINFTHDTNILVGQLHSDEQDYADLESASKDAYCRIVGFLDQQAYPYVLKIWHYMANITQGSGDNQRYKRFCLGRAKVLDASATLGSKFPAATAIGSRAGAPLQIYFLASREPGSQVENPRQTSAFHYPRPYGLRSPSFSRGTLTCTEKGSWQFFISGTASVVGHQSMHQNNLSAQLQEIVENIESLLAEATHRSGIREISRLNQATKLKLYLQKATYYTEVQQQLQRLFPRSEILILEGDVCREDLMLEIEGFHASPDSA